MYNERQQEIIQEIQHHLITSKKEKIIVSVDGTYASRNNNADHGTVTIVEHATPAKYLLHIAMKDSSDTCTPHQLESQLTIEGLQYVNDTCKLKIATVAHDGKNISTEVLNRVCGKGVTQAGDPWHAQKGMVKSWRKVVMEETRCERGNKKKKLQQIVKKRRQGR